MIDKKIIESANQLAKELKDDPKYHGIICIWENENGYAFESFFGNTFFLLSIIFELGGHILNNFKNQVLKKEKDNDDDDDNNGNDDGSPNISLN